MRHAGRGDARSLPRSCPWPCGSRRRPRRRARPAIPIAALRAGSSARRNGLVAALLGEPVEGTVGSPAFARPARIALGPGPERRRCRRPRAGRSGRSPRCTRGPSRPAVSGGRARSVLQRLPHLRGRALEEPPAAERHQAVGREQGARAGEVEGDVADGVARARRSPAPPRRRPRAVAGLHREVERRQAVGVGLRRRSRGRPRAARPRRRRGRRGGG